METVIDKIVTTKLIMNEEETSWLKESMEYSSINEDPYDTDMRNRFFLALGGKFYGRPAKVIDKTSSELPNT